MRRQVGAGRVMAALLRRARATNYAWVIDRPTARGLILVGIGSVVVSIFEVLALIAIQPLIQLLSGTETSKGTVSSLLDRWIGGLSTERQALALIGVIVFLLVTRAVLGALLRWWTIGFITEAAARATSSLLMAYLQAPLAFHASRNSAESTRTAALSLTNIYSNGLIGLSTALSEAAVIVLLAVLLAVVTPAGAGAAVLYFGLAMLIYNRKIHRRTTGIALRRDEIQAKWLTLLQQSLGALREIRLRNAENEFGTVFSKARDEQNHLERRIIFNADFGRYFLEIAFMLGFGLLASVILITKDEDSAAVLGLLLAAGFRLLPSASRLLNALARIREGDGSLSLLIRELEAMGRTRLPPLPTAPARDATPSANPHREPATVAFDAVSFQYPGSKDLTLVEISGEIGAGRSLGIVGSSGAGKTTMADLVSGLLLPTSGTVRVDGLPTTTSDRSWQQRLGYVPQEIFLLDGTLRQNIVFLGGQQDQEALDRAVALAQLEPWVTTLPKGLDTPVGERGVLLSGGQRQRVGIARALYRMPSVLILDEATSALDVETEAYLTSAINSLAGGLTLIIVAHRLSTVRLCSDIVLLEQGRVAGWGSFEALRLSNPTFARWVSLAGMDQSGRT